MIVESTDREASICIERQKSPQFIDYIVIASFRGESVTNKGIVFTEIAEFLRSLQAFERTRTGSAVLKGTDDCQVAVEADGQMGHAWLTFEVARNLYAFSPQTGRGRPGRIALSGSFPVSGEFIARMVRDFKELLG